MEHSELVAEMIHVERLTTQERLHLARHRRLQQLKVWRQREKEWLRHQTRHTSNKRHIYFSDSVMLLEAAARNDIDEVRRLLKKGVNPDSTNEDGLTALHQCCIDDNEEMMKLLIEFGANVNAEDSEKWTPLHAAATCGHLHLVKYLIARGANLLAVNADGNMPYDICEDEKTLDCIEGEMARRGVTQELIDETRASTEIQMLRDLQKIASLGGDLEYKDHQGATPLHIAAANGYVRVVEFLLDQHVSTDVEDNDKWQPVHAAACWGHLEVLELLVQNGADLNAKNKHDETPADICEDLEIRERIMELKTEQESKRLREAQGRRVRRSQSINTRTQSVRRTSIRDKVLTTKKDAQEEARLRLQAQQTYVSAPTPSIPPLENNTQEAGDHETDSNALTPAVRKGPEGKDNESFLHEDVDKDSAVAGSDPPVGSQQQSPIYATDSDTNGKINIHVSVVFVKSLSDLKKQRAQNRHISGSSLDANGNGIPMPVSSISNSDLSTDDFTHQRFTGNTSEIVGDNHSEKSCCTVM
ncbi:protein phosphatase 1 regulatory subunit 16A isoform X3 [Ooceraea biroi]|uniref:Protein phosphatase 1 regulatory subunit 16A n=2 Tax=Ooceraea biroi TaxID=2015173 RepID=A0A026WAI7_OOCBI|nr:protein phosphatase 1 regulatory subunit 16A isoform X3 [Ooceraea biroi]XP_011341286.1 protein phosphatase 1 regulatory subunit 16A isoform X3 [Ooceraea biroi]EZA52656.1 Protein phosphatase 1 regulatory subunit 16A [Ooceraea biroi]